MEKHKKVTQNNESKISVPTWKKEFEFLIDHILYKIFKNFMNISYEKMVKIVIIL